MCYGSHYGLGYNGEEDGHVDIRKVVTLMYDECVGGIILILVLIVTGPPTVCVGGLLILVLSLPPTNEISHSVSQKSTR